MKARISSLGRAGRFGTATDDPGHNTVPAALTISG
jgi:hypothetical protein